MKTFMGISQTRYSISFRVYFFKKVLFNIGYKYFEAGCRKSLGAAPIIRLNLRHELAQFDPNLNVSANST